MKIDMPSNVAVILNILDSAGYEAFIYGACIRDSLRGIKPICWEFTTNALPPDIVQLFDDRKGFTAIPALKDYSSINLIFQGNNYRINTFRTGEENRFSDNIEEELSFNDFSMNSIAYSDKTGLIDPFNGSEDIKQKVIKCAGDCVEKMSQDPVRMLRAVRFEAQLGFKMDNSLLKAIAELKDRLTFDSSERVANELTQIMLTDNPSTCIRRLLELGLLEKLIPELIPTIGFDTHSSFHDKDVFEHTLVVLDNTKPNLALRLAALLHDIDKPNCLTIDDQGEGHCYGHASLSAQTSREVLARLNYDRKTLNAVCALIKEHMNNYDNVSELGMKRLIRRVGPGNLDNLFELQLADIKGSGRSGRDIERIIYVRNKCWEMLSRREPLTTHDLDISGYDLMVMGYDAGESIGKALDYLLDKVVDNPALNEKKTLLELLKARRD
ncbi:MAG: CCA tRNA nucleotidyltransferase [Deltaproteobacteria bacterium]